jgi:hypothetical protein
MTDINATRFVMISMGLIQACYMVPAVRSDRGALCWSFVSVRRLEGSLRVSRCSRPTWGAPGACMAIE